MSLSTIRLHQNMKYADLVAALNQNFALLENLNKTLIMKDEKGVSRIIFGKLPDGNWGFVVSKPGVDIVKLYNS